MAAFCVTLCVTELKRKLISIYWWLAYKYSSGSGQPIRSQNDKSVSQSVSQSINQSKRFYYGVIKTDKYQFSYTDIGLPNEKDNRKTKTKPLSVTWFAVGTKNRCYSQTVYTIMTSYLSHGIPFANNTDPTANQVTLNGFVLVFTCVSYAEARNRYRLEVV